MMPKLLSVQDVAQILLLSEDRVYALIRARVLPAVHVGRQVRVDANKLLAWIESGGQRLGETAVYSTHR